MQVPQISDIKTASERIRLEAVRTPLIRSRYLDDLTGASVFIKPECLQRTGSFKFRGAFNTLSSLSESDLQKGIVACSSGNHAQGVALAARLINTTSTIIMPSDAPVLKIERTKAFGADIVLYDRKTEDRDDISAQVVEEKGAIFVHPFETFEVMAGQGTCGLELAEDVIAVGEALDRVLICCGGGGLAAGVATAVRHYFPGCRITIVEPEGFDDFTRSLAAGERVSNTHTSGSLCDAILTPSPGERAFSVLCDMDATGVTVSDAEAMNAVKFAHQELKLVLEPGGAVALAAILKAQRPFEGERVGVILSGGNIDPDILLKAIKPDIQSSADE